MTRHSAPARCVAVQGTTSHAGKSLLVTALCRWLHRAGVRVAPFKAQNMALNAAVCADGGEIGRAQAVQAEAAGIEPTVDMNPILLKPEGDTRSQLIVHGRPAGHTDGADLPGGHASLRAAVAESLARLRAAFDVVVIEGAGSPAEINLADRDLANMHAAALAGAPVLLVGDIDRGGLFAHFVGTLACLEAADRARVAGFVVNKFRGERALLADGLAMLHERTGVPVLGVLPWLDDPGLPAEDSVDLDRWFRGGADRPDTLDVAVVALPALANLDDFDALAGEPGVVVRLAHVPAHVRDADLVVLPGTKRTVRDLAWLRAIGFERALRDRAAAGGPILGICGGCQMLGGAIADPDGVEGDDGEGLGLLPVTTRFARPKVTARRRVVADEATWLTRGAGGAPLDGYVIHAGRTTIPDDAVAVASPDGAVVGTMLHGVLENTPVRRVVLTHLRARRGWPPPATVLDRPREAAYDRLVEVLRASCDLPAIGRLIGVAIP